MSWIFAGRGGALENTVFGILSPDGKHKLSKTGRSPGMVFGTVEKFEAALNEIAAESKATKARPVAALPTLPDLRVALDVAACDLRPLVVVFGEDESDSAELTALVAAESWSDSFVGRLRFVVLNNAEEMEAYADLKLKPGVSVVQAEDYGRGGVVLAHAPTTSDAKSVRAAMEVGLRKHEAKTKDVRKHIRQGERQGIEWQTAIPVTDQGKSNRR